MTDFDNSANSAFDNLIVEVKRIADALEPKAIDEATQSKIRILQVELATSHFSFSNGLIEILDNDYDQFTKAQELRKYAEYIRSKALQYEKTYRDELDLESDQ